MTTFNFVCVFVVAVCFNVVFTTEDTAEYYPEVNKIAKERPAGRAYSLTTCDYQRQVGYTCLTCHRALHCYPGNAAILVDCYGLFRFCRDGRCSRNQGDKCFSDTKLTTPYPVFDGIQNTNVTANFDAPAVELSTRDVTGPVTDTVILPLDPKDVSEMPNKTTKSDGSVDNVV